MESLAQTLADATGITFDIVGGPETAQGSHQGWFIAATTYNGVNTIEFHSPSGRVTQKNGVTPEEMGFMIRAKFQL